MDVRSAAWDTFGSLCQTFYASGEGARTAARDGWFAALSRTASAELNVCGLSDDVAVAPLLDVLGGTQPALVFTSETAVEGREVLASAGFEVADVAEPLMRCGAPGVPRESPFTASPASGEADLAVALRLTSAAHSVDVALLEASIGAAARTGSAQVWIARDGDEPVSAAWLCRTGRTLGVMEMMTPPQHQGRGAGRALLSTALQATWDDGIDEALLLATPAGRRLYESLGFASVDESLTCYRGLEDEVLAAIGQHS